MTASAQAVAVGDQAALTAALRSDFLRNHASIPDALKWQRAWLVWKADKVDPIRGKFGKVPHYPGSGHRRHGQQGSEEDRAALATWDDAFRAFNADPSIAGLGLAMLPELGMVALDADGCVKHENGQPIVAGSVTALCATTYAELSPSGSGVRAFWLGAAADGKNLAEGIELFHGKGFVTVTGNRLSGSDAENLSPELGARLQSMVAARSCSALQREPTELQRLTQQMAATEPVLAEVVDALASIPADDGDLWVRMGHALKTLGDAAEGVWHKWSATSSKYEREDAERVWESLLPTQTGHGAIIAEAKRRSWNGAPSHPPASHCCIISAGALAAKTFPPLRWTIPGLLPEGLAILAGKPKAGKSYLCMQMALAVASTDGALLGIGPIDGGDVLYCALEDGERRLRDRMQRMLLWQPPAHLNFATKWPRMDLGGIEQLGEWCDAHPNARLIILDTLRAIKPASNGRRSAYDEDANSVAPLLDFIRSRPGLACIIVHHVRKMDADDPFETISGTHGLTGIFDTLMVLAPAGTGAAKLAAQGRDLEPYEKAMERDQRTGGWIIRGDAIEPAKTGERQQLLDLLAKAGRTMALADLALAVGKQSDTTRRLLKGLIDEGRIYQPGHGLYAVTQIAQSAFDPAIF